MNRLFAAILIIVTLPLILFIALLIKINYPGSIFYQQVREGKNGKPFKILKLRTMITNSNEILQKMIQNDERLAKKWFESGWFENDPRIAGKLGKLSRELSIDELPQLINVLKGEMAFIGPRPLEISSVEALPKHVRLLRNSILPGITGLAQVEKRMATINEMQPYDRIYINKRNFCLNLYILLKTVTSIFKRTGS